MVMPLRALLPLVLLAMLVVSSFLRHVHAEPAGPLPPPALRMPAAGDLEAARQGLASPQDLERAMREQQGAIARVPASPEPPGGADTDLAEIAREYERRQRGDSAADGDEREAARLASGLLVFVSLGMPVASLEQLVADAERARAMLVLRGVQGGSLRDTARRIRDLLAGRHVPWQIDPSLFRRFAVEAVPTLVLIDPARPVLAACGLEQCQQPSFAKASGDVRLGYALAAIEREDAQFAPLARRFAARLQRGEGGR
jgi:conjugal transfer pilus assembly protein TrbC